ncbi:mismatch repair endonuclease PMS2-like [Dysidea avara]|uniref:mismatch repair endonuclease PMS2-like n=1 Tax=Dysidea avara TaxID=196820 RepID=UPI00331861DE
MSSVIKKIDAGDVHKICSGQVVLSLAVAVKELVENALDAGATLIEIRLKEYGKETVEVIDNGSGILPANYEVLALKHCTSKISEFADLATVGTFGFRGEALSSLCALSDLVVVTRHASQSVGTKLTFDTRGILQCQEACAREVGTSVSLSRLFYTLPVRYKEFQRNLKKEYNKFIQMLQGYCLISTNVKLLCYNQTSSSRGRQLVLSAGPNSSIKDNILNVFGSKQLQNIVEIVHKDSVVNGDNFEDEDTGVVYDTDVMKMFRITGYISRCNHGCGRGSNDRQFYFINNRPCDHPKLARVVNETYHLYNRHQQPFVVLCVSMDHGCVDVNVTPDKRQILIQQERALLALIKMILKEIFEPMQSEYELQSVDTPNASHDASITLPNDEDKRDPVISNSKTEITKLSGLKRSFSYHGAQQGSPSTATTGTPKKCHISKQKSLNDFGIRLKSNLTTSSIHDSNGHQNGVKRTHIGESPQIYGQDSSVTSFSGRDKQSLSHLDVSTSSSHCIEVDNVQQYCRDDNGRHQVVKFDTNLVKQRLQHGYKHNTIHGNTRIHGFRAKITPDSNEDAVVELRREIKKEMFPQMQIIGQFNLGFIICKLDNDIFIVDQHASDEKYNFERLQRDTVLKHQKLIQPLPLELTAVNEDILLDNIDIFKRNGFEFSIDQQAPPTKRVKLIGHSVSKDWSLGPSDVDELIFMLSDAPGQMCRPSRVSAMFASRACRSSIMIGTSLNTSEMKKILTHMGETEQPWNCPHGRPTMRHLVDLSLLDTS